MKRRTAFTAAAALALLAAGCAASGDPVDRAEARNDAVLATQDNPAPRRRTTTTFAVPDPTVADFHIDLLVLESECFGSAGALVVVEPELEYLGYAGLPQDSTWLLVYEIHGAEDREVRNIELDWDGTYRFTQPIRVGTVTCESYELTAELTAVLPR